MAIDHFWRTGQKQTVLVDQHLVDWSFASGLARLQVGRDLLAVISQTRLMGSGIFTYSGVVEKGSM